MVVERVRLTPSLRPKGDKMFDLLIGFSALSAAIGFVAYYIALWRAAKKVESLWLR